MKIPLLIIAVIFYSQPLQAGHCDMESGQAAGPHLEHAMAVEMEGKHDCCDEQAPEGQPGCNHAIQCGSCGPGVFSVATLPTIEVGLPDAVVADRMKDALASSHSHPLFRPPIC